MNARRTPPSRARSFVVLLCLLALGVATAGETGTRRYPLGREGVLLLKVPAHWREAVSRPDPDELPSIVYGVRGGERFVVTLKSYVLESPPDAASLRERTAAILDAVRPQAVELEIPIHELPNRSGSGWYFSATDIAPGPGGFAYLTRGLLQTRELTVDFTVLTNAGSRQAVDDALAMLGGALFMRRREAGTAAAP